MEGMNRVAYQKSKDASLLSKACSDLGDEVHLMLGVVGTSNKNVLKGSLGVDTKALGDRPDSLMAECSLSINKGSLGISGVK